MINKTYIPLLAVLVAAAISSPGQVTAAELSVGGTIAPSACTFTLDKSKLELGMLDFGSIDSADIGTIGAALTPQELGLKVECAALVAPTLKFTDGSSTDRVTTTTETYRLMAGAGEDAIRAGYFTVRLTDGLMDARRTSFRSVTRSAASAGAWPNNVMRWHYGNGQFLEGSAKITVNPYVYGTRNGVNLTDETQLLGSVSIELGYL